MPAGGSRGGLARSLQRAEAMLRSYVSPSLRRLLPPRPRRRGHDGSDDEDEEDEENAPAFMAPLEESFPGLRRCLCVWEDPRTETFRGRVRHHPGDSTDAAAAFSYHAVHPRVAERGAALHALLQHRHLLRLAHDYSRRLKAASGFLRRLLVLLEPLPAEPGAAQPLRDLCQELRTHAGHWSGLRRRMHGDPWLRPLLLRRREAVAHMRRALLLLALHAARLAERLAQERLQGLARAGSAEPPSPALLSDLFQGLEIYNRVVDDLALELGAAGHLPIGAAGSHGAASHHPAAFPAARVLAIVAAERGRLAAKRLQPLLQPRDAAEHACWEDVAVPWPPERGTAADTGPPGQDEPPELAAELRALCREDKELMGLVLGVLVASTDTLWHHVLQETLASSLEPPEPLAVARPSSAGWKSVRWLDTARPPAAEALHAQYRRLYWEAAGAALGHRLGLPHGPTGSTVAAAQELGWALAQGRWGGGGGVGAVRGDSTAAPHALSPPCSRCPQGVRGGAGEALPAAAVPGRAAELGQRCGGMGGRRGTGKQGVRNVGGCRMWGEAGCGV